MVKKSDSPRLELSRHLATPVLILALTTIPWFTGGRDAFGLFLIALLTSLLYFSWFIVSRHRALRISSQPRLIIWPLAGLIILSILSLLWSVSRFDTLGQLIVLISAGINFVIARDIFSEDELAARFFRILWLAIAGVVALIGIGMYIGGDYDRLISLFYWPNPMATFLLPAVLTAAHLASQQDKRRWLPQAVLGLVGAAFVLTYSRAAWLVALVALATWVAAGPWRDRLRHLAIGLCVAVALVAMSVTARGVFFKKPSIDVQQRVLESGQSTSVRDRLSYWRETTVIFSERPLLGWGSGTYREVHPAFQESPSTAGSNPHNSALQVLAELGVAGLACYLVLLVGWLRLGWQLWAVPNNRRGWLFTSWLVVSAMGLHSLLDLATNYPILIVLGAIWLSMALPAPKRWFEFRLMSWRYGLPWLAVGLVSLGLTWMGYSFYTASIEKQLIDITAPFDWDEASGRYLQLFRRPLIDPDYISYGVIQAVDRFEVLPNTSASDLDKWAEAARRASRLEPRDAKHVFALAVVEERQGKITEALSHYRRAIELDPYDNPQYQVAYALLLRREGFTNEALSVLRGITAAYTPLATDRLVSNLPLRLSAAFALMADIKHEHGDSVGAQLDLDRALQLVPGSQAVQRIRDSWSQ